MTHKDSSKNTKVNDALVEIFSNWNNTARVYTRKLSPLDVIALLEYLEQEYRLVDGLHLVRIQSRLIYEQADLFDVEVCVSSNVSVNVGGMVSVYARRETSEPLFGYAELIV